VPSRASRPDRPVAFVLSGGASLGAIQVGMLRALYERGIAPDLLVGTSVGAVNGAFIASRAPSLATVEALETVWLKLRRSKIFPTNPVTGLLGVLGAHGHTVPGRGLRSLLEKNVETERLEDAPIPLYVIATDLFTGAERRLSRGSAIDAVMASAAIPGVFPPVEWEDTELVDGGIANNAPISHAAELGARTVYVLPTGYACALEQKPKGALATGLHAVSLMIQQRLVMDIDRVAGDVRLVVLPPPCPLDVQATDFTQAEELIRRGHEGARAWLESADGGEARDPPSLHADLLRPHARRR